MNTKIYVDGVHMACTSIIITVLEEAAVPHLIKKIRIRKTKTVLGKTCAKAHKFERSLNFITIISLSIVF